MLPDSSSVPSKVTVPPLPSKVVVPVRVAVPRKKTWALLLALIEPVSLETPARIAWLAAPVAVMDPELLQVP